MKFLRLIALVLLCASPAAAQWQTPTGTIPVGRGSGAQGFATVGGGAGAGAKCLRDTTPPTFGDCSSRGTDGYVLTGKGLGAAATFDGFLQNGTAPTARTPNSKMRDFVNLRDYGVEGDGTTDDGPAIQRAINSLQVTGGKNRILRVSEGLTGHVFQIGAELTGIDNLRVECAPGMTFVSKSVIRSYFRFDGKSNVVFDGCTFDGNQPNLPIYSDEPNLNTKNAGISFATSQNLTVINSTFINLYTRAIDLRTGSGGLVNISNNIFTSPTPNQAQNYQHIDVLTFNGSLRIANNRFINTPMTNKGYGTNNVVISGQVGNVMIEGNYMDTCSRTNTVTTHRLGCIDFYYDAENVTVRNNTVKGINWEFMRLSNSWPTDIYGNVVRMNDDAASGSVISVEAFPFGFVGTDKGTKHVNIFDNKFFGSAVNPSHEAVACSVYDYAFPCTDVKVSNNSFTNFYTVLYVNGVYDGVQFNNNYVTGIWAGAVKVRSTVLTASYGVTEANSFAGRLSINDNKFVQTVTALNLPPVDIDMTTGHTYTGTMGTYEVSRNDISGIANTSSAISAIGGNSGPKGSLVTQQNNVTGYTTGQTLTNWAAFGSRSNLFSGATNRTVQSTVTVYNDLDLNTSKVAIVGTAGGTQYNFNLPTTAGSSGDCLKSAGGGASPMTWATCTGLAVGSTAISGGTTTRVLFDNAGTLGEYVISGTGNVAMTTNPVFTTPNLGTPSAAVFTTGTSIDLGAVTLAGSLPCARMPALTGDVTSSLGGCGTTLAATGVGAGGPTGSATVAPIITYDAKGRLTAVSSATVTPAIGSVTGLGTGVGTWLATPSSANLAAAVTDETGSGLLVFGTSPTITTPNEIGVTNASNAAAGSLGELQSATLAFGSALPLTSNVTLNVTQLTSLPAGDWDIEGSVYYTGNAATTATYLQGGIGTTSATIPGTGQFFNLPVSGTVFSGGTPGFATPTARFNISVPTTIFLTASATFAVNTLNAYGTIRARRVR